MKLLLFVYEAVSPPQAVDAKYAEEVPATGVVVEG